MAAKRQTKNFDGQVRVAARIIDLLSSGLYPNPAACLKELINNSYDADATLVEVFVKPDADQIVIKDDGHGFTREAFEKHFANVSESSKRESGETTKSGRKKIGMIGIGFIAANELCEEVEVFSTCKGSTELMHVTLNFAEMSKAPNERKNKDGTFNKADYEGNITADAKKGEHYTVLYLKKVKDKAKEILTSAKAASSMAEHEEDAKSSLYGLLPETIREKLADDSLKNWEQFDFYTTTMMQIALNVPVKYHNHWHPRLEKTSYLKAINSEVDNANFRILYDGVELRKPIVLREGRNFITEEFKFNGDHGSAKGYFFATHGTISPRDLQGLLIRIRGSAVGSYHRDFLGFPVAQFPLFQKWATCEIYASDGLEEAMNIDRVTFRDIHPAYVELRNAIHSSLHKFLKRVHDELYMTKRDKKRSEEKKKSLEKIEAVSAKSISPKSSKVGVEVAKSWKQDDITDKELLKTYTPAEILEMVSEVAEKVLPKKQFDQLILALNDRLLHIRRK